MTFADDIKGHKAATRGVLEALAARGVELEARGPDGCHAALAGGRGLVVRDERRQRTRAASLCLELLECPWQDRSKGVRKGALLRTPASAVVVHLHRAGAVAAPAWWWSWLAASHLGHDGGRPHYGAWRWGFRGDQRTGAWCYLLPWPSVTLQHEPAAVSAIPTRGDVFGEAADAVTEALEAIGKLPASTRTHAERHSLLFGVFAAALSS